MGDRTISITPDTLLMRHLGSSGHTLIKALSELIDNALDSFLEHRDELKKLKQTKLKVSIQTERYQGVDRIVIEDNAFGMSDKELHEALTIAKSAKPSSKVKELIGRFGMGMKTACSSLGKAFEVRTVCPDESQLHIVRYNEDDFTSQKEWKLKLHSEPKPQKTLHGTTITITALKKKVQGKTYLHDGLSPIFSFYITAGILELTVQDEPVQPSAPTLLTIKNAAELTTAAKPRDRWTTTEVKELVSRLKKIDFSAEGKKTFGFKVGTKKAEGWVGLLAHSSQRGRYGFNLIRHDRVVIEGEKIGFAEHPATARVVGEIHLDDWDVNYNKDDFIRDTDDWDRLAHPERGLLHECISEVVAISRRMAVRQKPISDSAHIEAEREGKKILELTHGDEFYQELGKEFVEEGIKRIGPSAKPELIKPITAGDVKDAQQKARTSLEAVSSVRHELEQAGTGSPYVSAEVQSNGTKRVLVVRTNADHPFFVSVPEDFRRWYYALLIADCLAEHVQKEIGYQSLSVLKNSILAQHGPRLMSVIRPGKDEFSAKLGEKA